MRRETNQCKKCGWYDAGSIIVKSLKEFGYDGRCRIKSPTSNGFPVVNGETDWCQEWFGGK